jgi:hypothetical protein
MNLMVLKCGGIDPSKVIFMSYGTKIGTDVDNHHGVKQNFVFNGATFLEEIRCFYKSKSEKIPDSNEGTVKGYMSGMAKEGTTRLYRDLIGRKSQVGN